MPQSAGTANQTGGCPANQPRHNILLADDTAVRAAVLTRAHPAPIPGPRLKIQKHDPTYCGGGEHDSGDGHEVHLLLPPSERVTLVSYIADSF